MRRLFIPTECMSDNIIYITDNDDIRYISSILRMKVGDELFVSDGVRTAYMTRVDHIDRQEILLTVLKKEPFDELINTQITLFQGLPKGSKIDEIIRKATELGVYEIIPIMTSRTVPDSKSGLSANKLGRLRRIAEEASRQSRRIRIPVVSDVFHFTAAMELLKERDYDCVLVLFELEESLSLKKALRMIFVSSEKNTVSGNRKIAVFIGPEGGFEREEIDLLVAKGALSVTIGETILRTETAGPAAIAMIMYELEL